MDEYFNNYWDKEAKEIDISFYESEIIDKNIYENELQESIDINESFDSI